MIDSPTDNAMIRKDFTKIPNTLIRTPVLSSVEKVVWCYISSMRDGYKYPVRFICEVLHIKAKTWRQCVSELQRRGMVSVQIMRGHTNVYKAITDTSGWNLPPVLRVGYSSGPPVPGDPSPQSDGYQGTHYNSKEDIYNTNIDDDVRERLKIEVMIDANIELACMSCGITTEQYKQLAAMIIADWTFQDLSDGEWTKKHFMNVLRYKVDNLKRKTNEKYNKKSEPGGISQTEDRYASRRGTDTKDHTAKDYGRSF